jgi:hypothetical protein
MRSSRQPWVLSQYHNSFMTCYELMTSYILWFMENVSCEAPRAVSVSVWLAVWLAVWLVVPMQSRIRYTLVSCKAWLSFEYFCAFAHGVCTCKQRQADSVFLHSLTNIITETKLDH